jgi:hypothetical protein
MLDSVARAAHRASRSEDERPRTRSTRVPALFVGAVWLALTIAAVVYVARYGSSIPFGDDLEMVGPSMPGFEPGLDWLWSAHNEHRVPIARALFVALVRVFHDLRAVMYGSVAILALLALAMIVVARSVRGRTSWFDAFFPVLWLHWGNYQNLLTAFQISVTLAAAVAGTILVLVVGARAWTRASAVACGACVCLLALNGGHGLAQMPALVAWLALAGFARLRSSQRDAQWTGRALLASAALATALIGVYFAGLASATETMHAHSFERIVAVAIQFLGLALGAAGARTWVWSLPLVLTLCLASLLLLAKVARERPGERVHAAGILAVLAGVFTLALAVGWGRGDVGWGGFAVRYVTLPATALCCIDFAWCRYGTTSTARWVQAALFALVLGVLPINFREGLRYGRERARINAAVRADIARGMADHDLAARYSADFYSEPSPFERQLNALRDAAWPPFDGSAGADPRPEEAR